MRALHTFDHEPEARTLADVLLGEDMKASVSATRDGKFQLWVHDDEKLEDARVVAEAFRSNPDDLRFRQSVSRAKDRQREEAERARQAARRVDAARKDLERSSGLGAVTTFLVLAIVGVQVLAYTGRAESVVRVLAFVDLDALERTGIRTGFESILHGQVWRLVTPIALSAGVVGAIFDALWIFYLAGAFERAHRSRYLILFVLAAAAITNSAEVAFGGNLLVFGTTGLYHALFAYLFVRERLDARFQSGIPLSLAAFIVLFDLLAIAHVIEPAMISARLSGLAFGAIVGALRGVLGRPRVG